MRDLLGGDKSVTMDSEDYRWITTERDNRVKLDSDGNVLAGFGGEFNGQHISSVQGGNNENTQAQSTKGSAMGYESGNGGDGNTTQSKIISVEPIDFSNEAAVNAQIEDFAEKYKYADVEYARIVSPDGNVYTVEGGKTNVDIACVGEDALQGSVCIHNHPVPQGEKSDDSFSEEDWLMAGQCRLSKNYLVSGERRDVMEFTNFDYVTETIWDIGLQAAWEKAIREGRNVELEQQEILQALNGMLKGFSYYENF